MECQEVSVNLYVMIELRQTLQNTQNKDITYTYTGMCVCCVRGANNETWTFKWNTYRYIWTVVQLVSSVTLSIVYSIPVVVCKPSYRTCLLYRTGVIIIRLIWCIDMTLWQYIHNYWNVPKLYQQQIQQLSYSLKSNKSSSKCTRPGRSGRI